MKIDIITIFPNAFSYLSESIVKRGKEKEKVEINIVDLREFGVGKWKKVDDKIFGGGAGMLFMVDPIYKALKSLGVYPTRDKTTKVILTSARGSNWNQKQAEYYSSEIKHLVIICGHYEGVDQRVIDNLIDEEVSIGNYVLSGGELPAMIISDSIIRLLDGVLGNEESAKDETFFDGDKKIAEYPQYTRPETYTTENGEEWKVPDILLSGNHGEIEKWKESKRQTVSS